MGHGNFDFLNSVHLCVDMQRMFAERTQWHVEWFPRVLPNIVKISQIFAGRNIYTRFIPPYSADDAKGAWKDYYKKWEAMTLRNLDRSYLDLVPELQNYADEGNTVDKGAYSPWVNPRLKEIVGSTQVSTLVVTGGETDICVLATIMGAMDRGYKIMVVEDAVCSSRDETHDAIIKLYTERFDIQVGVITTDNLLKEALRFIPQ